MSLLVAFIGALPEAQPNDPMPWRALAAAARQGHGTPTRLNWPGGHAAWFATPGNNSGSGACVQQGARFAACVGSAHWQGLTGEALLKRVLADFSGPQSVPWRDFSGGFAMLLCDGHAVWLCNDAVGLQKVYTNAERSLFTTSLLLCRSTLTRPQVNRLRAQEYVLLGSTHALDTPVQGVHVQDPTLALDLRSGAAVTVHAAKDWRMPTAFGSMREAVQTLSSLIAGDFASMISAYGPKIGMALSGGFDSRLLLAALDHHGVAPSLYVYGRPGDEDVRVANAKAAELGLPIECVDKGLASAALPRLDAARLAANLAFFDGLPVDGAFDRGVDQATRLSQVRDGTLNLNGGGGEILRNFFYLPDRSFSAEDLVGAFYSNWLPGAIPDRGERRALLNATADGILGALGFEAGTANTRTQRLSRTDVELVYSLFRLRYWMGRNNSVAARYGAFLTPLAHPRLVQLTATVPLAWKTYGELEARIIRALSPRVARGASNYGFEFSAGPTAAHRRHVNTTLFRPIALRRRSARLRRLLGRNRSAQAPLEWAEAFSLPAQDWIDPAHLTDMAQINRLLTLSALLDDPLCGLA